MSELTITLNQILDFVAKENQDIIREFNLGLTVSEIEEIVEVLPFKLTNEVIDLYSWRDGTSSSVTDIIAHSFFLPLNEAVGIYEEMMPLDIIDQNNNDSYFWQVAWFPILTMDQDYYFVSCRNDESAGKVYKYFIAGGEPEPMFSNLTIMMKAILDCYQTGVYKIDPESTILSLIDEFEEKKIFAKNDPDNEFWKTYFEIPRRWD